MFFAKFVCICRKTNAWAQWQAHTTQKVPPQKSSLLRQTLFATVFSEMSMESQVFLDIDTYSTATILNKRDDSVLCLTFPTWLYFRVFLYHHRYSAVILETCRVPTVCRHSIWFTSLLMTAITLSSAFVKQSGWDPWMGQTTLLPTFGGISIGFITTCGITGSKNICILIFEGYC